MPELPHVVSASPLSERLAEVIDEFAECNEVTVADVLEALELTHATVERDYYDGALH